MTDSLYIVMPDTSTTENLSAQLTAYAKEHCTRSISHNRLSRFRVDVTTRLDLIWIEPYFGSASLRALYDDRKKRSEVQAAIISLIAWCTSHADQVGLCFESLIEEQGTAAQYIRISDNLDFIFSQRFLPSGNQIIWIE
ncbi:MAG: hypothetical protein ACFCU8_05655 [Thermosynechococcaceae cyanobacterium]